VRAVDVRVHRREAVGKAFGNERLRGQMVALVELVTADDVEDAGITFQTRRVQRYFVEQV
jgi:hypothetical protein